jgi:hypothetical protein
MNALQSRGIVHTPITVVSVVSATDSAVSPPAVWEYMLLKWLLLVHAVSNRPARRAGSCIRTPPPTLPAGVLDRSSLRGPIEPALVAGIFAQSRLVLATGQRKPFEQLQRRICDQVRQASHEVRMGASTYLVKAHKTTDGYASEHRRLSNRN